MFLYLVINKIIINYFLFLKFSFCFQKCEEHLAAITEATSIPVPPSEELLAKYFCSIKEFCQLCATNITPSVISVLKVFSACVRKYIYVFYLKICD